MFKINGLWLVLFFLLCGMTASHLPVMAETIEITANRTSIRQVPVNGGLMRIAHQGELFQVLEKRQGWLKVEIAPGIGGWVDANSSKVIIQTPPANEPITTPLATEPEPASKPASEAVQEPSFPVSATSAAPQLGTATVVIHSLKVRDVPLTGRIVGLIRRGETYEIVEKTDQFIKIQLENSQGWVSRKPKYVTIEQPEPSPVIAEETQAVSQPTPVYALSPEFADDNVNEPVHGQSDKPATEASPTKPEAQQAARVQAVEDSLAPVNEASSASKQRDLSESTQASDKEPTQAPEQEEPQENVTYAAEVAELEAQDETEDGFNVFVGMEQIPLKWEGYSVDENKAVFSRLQLGVAYHISGFEISGGLSVASGFNQSKEPAEVRLVDLGSGEVLDQETVEVNIEQGLFLQVFYLSNLYSEDLKWLAGMGMTQVTVTQPTFRVQDESDIIEEEEELASFIAPQVFGGVRLVIAENWLVTLFIPVTLQQETEFDLGSTPDVSSGKEFVAYDTVSTEPRLTINLTGGYRF